MRLLPLVYFVSLKFFESAENFFTKKFFAYISQKIVIIIKSRKPNWRFPAFLSFLFNIFPVSLGGLFRFVVTESVVFFALHVIGEILLIHPVVGVGVGILVALEKGALKLGGNALAETASDVLCRRIKGAVCRI